ncbi:hypothetical protein Poli38472_001169 [Pythium oligandrum]|uniref:Uncharacterized protein n=1 Tax=Pythium oligandrum TaxID=41045 RepID=A0A8K1FSY1_PYTOL|nr:hypothetical protein Poli38472_001169 [Pythium oligandrum]|eukprot:TMW69013.1 hypothetical protein Poli38472_001169 [Pythium oligandrum]
MQKLTIFFAALLSATASAESIFNLDNCPRFQIPFSNVDGLAGTYTKIENALAFKHDGDSNFFLVQNADRLWQLVGAESWTSDEKDWEVYFTCNPGGENINGIDREDVCAAGQKTPPRAGYTPGDGTSAKDHLILLEFGGSS